MNKETDTSVANGIRLFEGNCLTIMDAIEPGSIDLVIADLPYGTTPCAWDFIIDPKELWIKLLRVAKKDAAFVFTAVQPFTWMMCSSAPDIFRYGLIWEKPNGTNPFQARVMPMKRHEDILVFYAQQPTYNPQMVPGKPYKWDSRRSKGEAGGIKQNKPTPIDNKGQRYPSSVLRFKQERGLHPTQKPIELMSWIMKTYSNPGETVLDPTMGSGTTGVACMRNNRSFIGIEKDPAHFNTASTRIAAEILKKDTKEKGGNQKTSKEKEK